MNTLPNGWKDRCFTSTSGGGEDLVGVMSESAGEGCGGGAHIVEPEVGMAVVCSRQAPAKVRALFAKHGDTASASAAICEVREAGECKIIFANGHLVWCCAGKGGCFHLSPSVLSGRSFETNARC